jgi:hypothetical protein
MTRVMRSTGGSSSSSWIVDAGLRTLAELLHHFDHGVLPGLEQPRQLAQQYKRMSVLGAEGGPWPIRVFKYRMNASDPPDFDARGRIHDTAADQEARRANESIRAWLRTLQGSARSGTETGALSRLRTLQMGEASGAAPRRLRRVFAGKGGPRDIALVLSLLDCSGRFGTLFPGVDSQAAMQSYCDEFIGVDCSGFANSYFTAVGRRSDDLTDRPAIDTYARAGRRLAAIPGSPRNHVFCWIRGESRTSLRPGSTIDFEHILVVDDWVRPPDGITNDPAGSTFRCTQSSASLGGLTTQVYEILRAPSAGARAATWRIQRVDGLGDNVLTPDRTVWNDVFLAPPF